MYSDKKVLIVDDSAVERHVMKGILSQMGFAEIFEADCGETGIIMAAEKLPDLILMDVVMPGINGNQAVKQILANEKLAGVSVIMCTSKNEDKDKQWSARHGAKAYVVKPINPSLLTEEIKKVLPEA